MMRKVLEVALAAEYVTVMLACVVFSIYMDAVFGAIMALVALLVLFIVTKKKLWLNADGLLTPLSDVVLIFCCMIVFWLDPFPYHFELAGILIGLTDLSLLRFYHTDFKLASPQRLLREDSLSNLLTRAELLLLATLGAVVCWDSRDAIPATSLYVLALFLVVLCICAFTLRLTPVLRSELTLRYNDEGADAYIILVTVLIVENFSTLWNDYRPEFYLIICIVLLDSVRLHLEKTSTTR